MHEGKGGKSVCNFDAKHYKKRPLHAHKGKNTGLPLFAGALFGDDFCGDAICDTIGWDILVYETVGFDDRIFADCHSRHYGRVRSEQAVTL